MTKIKPLIFLLVPFIPPCNFNTFDKISLVLMYLTFQGCLLQTEGVFAAIFIESKTLLSSTSSNPNSLILCLLVASSLKLSSLKLGISRSEERRVG